MPKGQRGWTDDEVQQAKSLYAKGTAIPEIALVLKRSTTSVRRKLEKLKAPHNNPGRLESSFVHDSARTVEASRPSEEALRERDRRLSQPVSMFGDPPRGYSALDRKRNEGIAA